MTAKRLMVLGAGRHQVGLIRRAEARGLETIAVDYLPDSPGKSVATHPVLADALDVAANIELAARYDVDGVVTLGTDQTVLVVAEVAAAHGLPCHVDPEAALAATNKSHMRQALESQDVPVARAHTITPDDVVDPRGLHYPLVVKPVDSQGQRGTSRVDSAAHLAAALDHGFEASRSKSVVVEEFVTGPEVTINAWVDDGAVSVLAITDRVTYNPHPYLGICLRHIYPSRHVNFHAEELHSIAARSARAFGMQSGPLYIQVVIGPEGCRVMEAAARVGGGHEASLLPMVTGVDLLDRSIDLALGESPARAAPTHRRHGLVNFVVAHPGRFAQMSPMDEVVDRGLADEAGWYYAVGYEQSPIVNSMGRIGYYICTAPDASGLVARADAAYDRLAVCDPDGRNLVFWPDSSELSS